MSKKQEEGHFTSISDLRYFCRIHKRKMWMGGILLSLLGIIWAATSPVEYIVEASFKENSKAPVNSNPLSAILISGLSDNDDSASAAMALMNSKRIIGQLVQREGLQASISKRAIQFQTLETVLNNFWTEFSLLTRRKGLILSQPEAPLMVRDVAFDEEKPLQLTVKINSEDLFHVFERDGNSSLGQFGVPLSTKHGTFTLSKIGSQDVFGEYTLTLLPLEMTIANISKRILIESDREDKTLLKLKYRCGDRFQGATCLNALMEIYQEYLRNDQKRISDEQIKYLQMRQDHMQAKLQKMMDAHATVLAADATNTGFLNSNRAMEFLARQIQDHSQRLMGIDLEFKCLEKAQKEGPQALEKWVSRTEATSLNDTLARLRFLQQQADSLDLAIKGRNIEENSSFNFSDEIAGLDLSAARDLYIDYNKQLDSIDAELLKYRFIIDQLKIPEFEISALSTILDDPVSKNMIAEASAEQLATKDKNNRSAKEVERIHYDLAVHKKFIEAHLQHAIQLHELNKQQLENKILSLQRVNLRLTHQEISVLQEHLVDYIKHRMEMLSQEQETLQQHQKELQREIAKWPTQWVSEMLIEQQMDMNKKMVEEVTKLVESRNISSNIEVIQSTPVDIAVPPLQPKSPNIILFAVLGAFLGAFLPIAWCMTRSIICGMPVTSDNLKLSNFVVCGSFSDQYESNSSKPLLDHDLNTLRHVMSFLERSEKSPGNVALLLTAGQQDYSSDLASLLVKKGLKVLRISLSFDSQKESAGLLQYLEGHVSWPQIYSENGYHFISAGGVCRFANELIGTQNFKTLLNKLRMEYDWIFLTSSANSTAPEAKTLLQYAQCGVVTITDQTWPEIQGLIETGKELAFIS